MFGEIVTLRFHKMLGKRRGKRHDGDLGPCY